MKKVWLYERTSKDTAEAQIQELRDFANTRGWTVVGESEDTINTLTPGKPGFDAAVAALKSGLTDAVLTSKIEWIGRSAEKLRKLIKEAGRVDLFEFSNEDAQEYYDAITAKDAIAKYGVDIIPDD